MRAPVKLLNSDLLASVNTGRLASLSLLLAAGILLMAANDARAELRAGAAKLEITSETPTIQVNDPLYARALVFDDGKTMAVIVSVDVALMWRPAVDRTKAHVEKQLGIPPDRLMLCATNNHHDRGQITANFDQRIAAVIKNAMKRMEPVKIGAGHTREERISISRRSFLKNGQERVNRRGVPSPQNELVQDIGPFDPEVGILRVNRMDGRPRAVLYNFSAHAESGVPGDMVTADYPGFASQVIEKSLGGEAIALFVQGACGDINPIRYKDMNLPFASELYGSLLGATVLMQLPAIEVREAGPLRMTSRTIQLPLRRMKEDVLDWIKDMTARQEEILQYFTGIGCGTQGSGTSLNSDAFLPLYLTHLLNPQYPAFYADAYIQEEKLGKQDLRSLDKYNRAAVAKYREHMRLLDELIELRANLHIMEDHAKRTEHGPVSSEVQGLQIGSFVLISYEGDMYVQAGLNIKAMSPWEHTYIANCANGYNKYSPDKKTYEGRYFGACEAKLSPEWYDIYVSAVKDVMGTLRQEKAKDKRR